MYTHAHKHAQTSADAHTYTLTHSTPIVLGLISTVDTHPLCVINNKRV